MQENVIQVVRKNTNRRRRGKTRRKMEEKQKEHCERGLQEGKFDSTVLELKTEVEKKKRMKKEEKFAHDETISPSCR